MNQKNINFTEHHLNNFICNNQLLLTIECGFSAQKRKDNPTN